MLVSRDFGTMELTDARIARMLKDVAPTTVGGVDGVLTYGPSVDVPSSLKITASPKIETKKRNGDSQLKDVFSKINEIEVDVEASEFSLDALSILIGGKVIGLNATGEDVSLVGTVDKVITSIKYSLRADNVTAPYFKLEGKWKYVNEEISATDGDAHMIIYKCKCTDAPSFEIVDSSNGFGTVKFKALALASKKAGDWFDLDLNSEDTAIF